MLDPIRKEIEAIDRTIIQKLAQRFKLAEQIGDIKRQNKQSVQDPEREQQLESLYRQWAIEENLDPALILPIFERVLKSSKEVQS